MAKHRYVILGGGVAGGHAAKEFLNAGVKKGELALVSAEKSVPYERPPLSKSFLAGEKAKAELSVVKEDAYAQHGVALHLNTRVSRVDTARSLLETEKGEEIGYEKLLLATGSSIRELKVEGASEADILYLRTVEQSARIRKAMAAAENPVVIGGGFIGMEVSAVIATQKGRCTLVFPETRLMEGFFTERMSAFFERYYRERGVDILPNASVSAFSRENGRKEVHLASGDVLPADLIVAGTGVEPRLELMKAIPIETDRGVLVSESLETTVPNVYAAGDIAEYPDAVFHKRQRVEHWQVAADQGELAAHNMTGARDSYSDPPYFFSDEFDLSWEFWGDQSGTNEAYHVGDIKHGSFSVWWTQDGAVRATFVMGRIDEERQRAKRCVEEQLELPRDIQMRGTEMP